MLGYISPSLGADEVGIAPYTECELQCSATVNYFYSNIPTLLILLFLIGLM